MAAISAWCAAASARGSSRSCSRAIRVSATWRARLDEHLGNYTVEGLDLRAASFFVGAARNLRRHASRRADAAAARARSARRPLSTRSTGCSTSSTTRCWLRRWSCASNCSFCPNSASASISNSAPRPARAAILIYVSPKSGRAVSRSAGEPGPTGCCGLPAFLRDATATRRPRYRRRLCAHRLFPDRHVLEPRGLSLGDERAHFIAALARALPSAA